MPLRSVLPLIVMSLLATPAFASDPVGPSKEAPGASDAPDDVPQVVVAPLTTMTLPAPTIEAVRMPADFEAPSRGVALPLLYGSYAALQAYDAASTLHGVSGGGVEVNPMMAGVSRSPAAMWAIKASVTAASVIAAERLWRSHRRGQAIAIMAIANGVMAGVALHNASVINAIR